jgi:hypothetical protein
MVAGSGPDQGEVAMMRTRVRRLIGIGCLAVLVTVLSTFVGTVGASAVKSPPSGTKTWRLVDYQQHGCFSPNVHDSWFGIYINGRWTTSIDVGASNLPAGGTFDTSYAPVAPGSSSGIYSLAYVRVHFATPPPVGIYTASMWASDGATTQQVSITLDVRTRCGY